MTALALQARGISHRYGSLEALQNICFELPAGTRCGLIGPDTRTMQRARKTKAGGALLPRPLVSRLKPISLLLRLATQFGHQCRGRIDAGQRRVNAGQFKGVSSDSGNFDDLVCQARPAAGDFDEIAIG